MVTGAGSGIGRSAALALAGDGFALVLAGRRMDRLEAVRDEIAAAGGEAMACACDISDRGQVEALFAASRAAFPRLDLLFNNAGIAPRPANFGDTDPADWMNAIAINLTGAYLCAREAFRQMRAQSPQGGRIINNGSISAHSPRPGSAAYTASKHGMTGLTKAISLDGREYSIACGQIDIGNAATEMAVAMKEGVVQASGHVLAEPMIDLSVVAQSILHMARLPLGANAQFLTIIATNMPFIGRG